MDIEEMENAQVNILATLKQKDIEILKTFLDYDKKMLKIFWHELYLFIETRQSSYKVIDKKRDIRKFRDLINQKIIAIEYYKRNGG